MVGLRGGQWRDGIRARAERLRNEIRFHQARRETMSEVCDQELKDVFKALNEAERFANDRVGPWQWWTGSSIQAGWRRLRQAEEALIEAAGTQLLCERARLICGQGERDLGTDDIRVRALRERVGDGNPDAGDPQLRLAALDVLRAANEAADHRQQQVRAFRNRLVAVSGLLLALALVLILSQAGMRERLIPDPQHGHLARAAVLPFVMFFGCVGALFSTVPSLAQQPKVESPFNLPAQQALLKITTGAWSAVLGLLLVNAGLTGQSSTVASIGALAALATVFGAGQEAITRFADTKARDVLGTG